MTVSKREIYLACEATHFAGLHELVPFQGSLKSLSKEKYQKLRREILNTGFAFPIHVWDNGSKLHVIGGHQRLYTLLELEKEGYVLPNGVPIIRVLADSEKQARRRILQDIAQYGEISQDKLYEFIGISEIGIDDLLEGFALPGIDLLEFRDNFFDDPINPDSAEDPSIDRYTKKIKSPIYQPMGPRPEIAELFNTEKRDQLITKTRPRKYTTSP